MGAQAEGEEGLMLMLTLCLVQISRPPPVLGQHSSEVLQELGYSREDIKGFRAKGAVGAGA